MVLKKTNEFALKYRKHFGINCKKAMIGIRLETAISVLSSGPDIKCYEVATLVGLPDELALYKYFIRHLQNPPTYYRKRIMKTDSFLFLT